MNFYEFTATGHPNVRAMHKTTLEFTKSPDLLPEGDCIVAVNADFDAPQLKHLVHGWDKMRITISAGFTSDVVEAVVNKSFDDDNEIVIRMGEFDSARTLGIRADKAAVHLNRNLIEKLRNPAQKVVVKIEKV
ncbi:DUF371 domain-containing protein [Candidatus Woesearchaeota archaeon]|nr:DUF371 domain-containing protein [Candidatus Woesearchaeota archaeon]